MKYYYRILYAIFALKRESKPEKTNFDNIFSAISTFTLFQIMFLSALIPILNKMLDINRGWFTKEARVIIVATVIILNLVITFSQKRYEKIISEYESLTQSERDILTFRPMVISFLLFISVIIFSFCYCVFNIFD